MTARLPGWRGSGLPPLREVEENTYEERVYRGDHSAPVSTAAIDEAVQNTLSNIHLGGSSGAVVRDLLATDTNSGIAQAYFNDLAKRAQTQSRVQAARKPLVVPYALDDDSAAVLAKYAVEFNLQYTGRDIHDHPLAAAMRIVDRALVRSRVPPSVPFIDVGGAVLPHISEGTLGKLVHVCAPLFDRKDGVRLTLQNLQAKKIASDTGKSPEARAAAHAYLDRNPAAVCGKRAQECLHRARVATSVHVYDIPLADWPYVMNMRGIDVVEGCLLFSPKIFGEKIGTYDSVGARYEVDTVGNRFTMSFVNSPAMLYEHRLDEYLAYGVDQLLRAKVGTYSYKIIERRGDTIFFRILRVSDQSSNLHVPVYRMPGVPMVEVWGFDPSARAAQGVSGLTRVRYVWPAPLWDSMVSHAVLSAERNQLTHELMYNYYRTIAPRQTINSTLVFGGYTVTLQQCLPLVVNSVLAALSECARARKETNAITQSAVARRARLAEFNLTKVVKVFMDSLKALVMTPFLPLVWLAGVLDDSVRRKLSTQTVEWEPIVSVCEVDFSNIASVCSGVHRSSFLEESVDERDFDEDYDSAIQIDSLAMAFDDPALARKVLDTMESELPDGMVKELKAVATPVEEVAGASESFGVPGTDTASATLVAGGGVDAASILARRAAVEEAIVECRMEQRHLVSACAVAARELMTAGKPNTGTIDKRREEYHNPEFWWLDRGVVSRSSAGGTATDFCKAAVYLLRPCAISGESLCPVYVEETPNSDEGGGVEYSRIADISYTGWALTTDSLGVYNGPEIISTLVKALEHGSFDFEVVLEQGPPGCGKTTAVVKEMKEGDYVMSPARESCRDTKEKIRDVHKGARGDSLARRVRTLDSYLVNYGQRVRLREETADRLLADECFMARYGKWCAAAALLHVQTIVGYGDKKQIPHVPRVSTPRMHLTFIAQSEKENWLSWRCPATAIACWGHIYDWRVRSGSGKKGTVQNVTSSDGIAIPDGCVMMGMYQADKKAIKAMYAGKGSKFKVMTVHESQGKTFPHVWLHRFDARKRTDNFSLYDRAEYVLVAMSRHTEGFVYISPRVGDMVSQYIERGRSVRRVNAAGDVASAGKPLEFL